MMSKEKMKGHLLIFLANVLFAVNMPISKYLLPGHLTPEALTIMRMLFACVMFWITSLFVRKEHVPLKDIGLLFICAFCGIALNQGLFIQGLNVTSPIDASIIATGVPIFVMILAAIILKEPITRQKAFGVFLGIGGAVMLILQSADGGTKASSLAGNLMIVTSGLSYSVYLVLSKPLTEKYSSVTIMKWMFLFASLMLLPFTFNHIAESPAFQHGGIDLKEVSAIAYVLFGATFLPYLLIPMSLKRIRPTTVSMYNYVQPIVASLITVLVGQDTFGPLKLLAAALVFVGVYLVTQSKSRADLEREQEENK
ncbi:drug/metabolite transporter (DMT)-like permease [Parabacteroides sp. PFB2-10]|uniref:DMT family transporter n=1 Tax=Parabacteroides sp. PFB2-10 TaxID=1742405 RepID=UPI0024767D4D|nr:DMT family transporter [Parabacteroides sp. PFB2-10]MDH6311723.1 drug/metabolite transporter (DMT)-like permease [Parabacteroides sp. PFB2-10]MDL2245447.1 DMT family transporter [Parabacteroides sp. OttesenSCG-928-J18]